MLLAGRLSPPRLPGSLVERSRLLRELDGAPDCPLTLISASAGWGKTTLLSAWAVANTWEASARESNTALAWLSLEESDDDPIRFWSSVIAALRRIPYLTKVGTMGLAWLHSQEATPPLEAVLATILAEIAEIHAQIILVLDDYHVIDDTLIHAAMLFFIQHLPTNLHLVLSTRTDPEFPLSRWRVHGQLIEIRDADLRFTHEEAADFLKRSVGQPLSEQDTATLQSRTEGWIAGLQLAALSLRKRPDINSFIQEFGGSHRYLMDYVQQDILERLPLALQDFLLQTSVVTRVNAALCQALTAEPSIQVSSGLLQEVERSNLFLVPLDEERQWYRYHDLFREALQGRLRASRPVLVPLLHLRAARWYETQGEWREAIEHALAAPDYALAVSLVEQAASVLWQRGDATSVHSWLLAIPDSDMRAHLQLLLEATLRLVNSVHISTEARYAEMAAQVEQTIARMDGLLAAQAPTDDGTDLIRSRLRLLRALIEVRAYFKRGDTEQLRALMQELERLPPDKEVSWRMIPLSFAFWLTLALPEEYTFLIPRLRESKRWVAESGNYLETFRVMTWLARAYIHAGQLRLAHQECREALTLLEGRGVGGRWPRLPRTSAPPHASSPPPMDKIDGGTPVAGYLLASLFDIYYSWNELAEASSVLRRLLEVARDWQQVELMVMGQRATSQVAIARGDLATARVALEQAERYLDQEQFANNARWVAEMRVALWLASGDHPSARKWAARTSALSSPDGHSPRTWEVLLVARVLLAEGKYAQALEMLERSRQFFEQPGDTEKRLEWMALRVVSLLHTGKRSEAAHTLSRLLETTEPESNIRLYLDVGDSMRQALERLTGTQARRTPYIFRLQRAFDEAEHGDSALAGRPRADQRKLLSPPLSQQELRVLRLLVAGQTYAEMAEALVVSPNTIKTQVGSIYRKLGVNRRAEAISAFARLQLI
jgi:LuxR family maltose regulon positive regulatory protein